MEGENKETAGENLDPNTPNPGSGTAGETPAPGSEDKPILGNEDEKVETDGGEKSAEKAEEKVAEPA